jgi:ankyrin repeat protein
MKYLRAKPTCVSKALAENLIRAAIEDCNATMVTALLRTGIVKADEIVCLVKGCRYTAVQRSVMLQSIEVTKALLVAGADVNKSYLWQGSLGLAIRKPGSSEPVDIQLVNLLLKYRAEVMPTDLADAANKKDLILVKILMSKFSASQRHDYLQADEEFPRFIEEAVKSLDHDSATSLVREMLQSCKQTGCCECPKSSAELRKSTSIAALRGFSKIINLVLEYIPEEDLPLAEAVRSGQQDVVELLLEHGADVDTPASNLAGEGILAYTPLAEAIRGGNNELVQNFEKRGALSNISEQGRFRAAIYAAAEVKNIAYVQKLLREAPEISGEAMDLALEISIKEGHEELALLLLRAGADVNCYLNAQKEKSTFLYKDDIASLLALRQKNEILVRAVMDCNMKVIAPLYRYFDSPLLLAARWGNLSIIRDLLSMGADVDGDGQIDDVRHKKINPHNDDEDDEDDDDGYSYYDNKGYFRETAITAAVKGNNRLLVELLVTEHRASLNLSSDRKTSPLAAAISNKDVNMFRYLLELGADPACHSAFRKAISEDKEMLPELLRAFHSKYPAGKVGFGSVPLRIAITHNDEQVLDALLEAKLDVNAFAVMKSKKINSLGTAIRQYDRHKLEIFEKLISAGSDPNGVVVIASEEEERWVSPKTALLEAISTENRALVELLVRAGAKTDRAAQWGIKRTPLQRACEIGSLEIVDFLLGRGVDVNEEPAFRGGGTSLQLCAVAGHPVIADKLLKLGADVHAARPEMQGRTALEGAAEHGRLDMLKILWYATGSKGFDPVQVACAIKLAEKNGHFACRHLIQQLHFMGQAFVMPNLVDF